MKAHTEPDHSTALEVALLAAIIGVIALWVVGALALALYPAIASKITHAL